MVKSPAGYFNGMKEKRMDEILELLPPDGIECTYPSVSFEYTALCMDYCRKRKLLSG